MRCAGHLAGMGEKCIYGFIGKLVGNRLLRRPRHRWDDNIKIDSKGIGWEGMDWINLVHDED
jgi:hypothetical protein